MKIGFFKQHSLKDGDDLEGLDRGDNFTPPENTPPTDEEKKLAAELKEKQEADKKATEEKAEADKKKAEKKDEDEDETDPEKRKDSRIPLARHKAMIEAERAEKAQLLAKLAQYQQGEDLQKTNEEIEKAEDQLLKMEAEYTKLVADGKTDEAAKVMSNIRKTERTITEMRGDLKAQAAEARAYERARYDTTCDRVEEAYPQLRKPTDDSPNDEYDPELTKKVLRISRAYQQDGMTPSEALQTAVKDLLGAPKTKKQENAVEVKARVDEAAVAKAKREEEAREKAAKAAGATPPNAKGVGKDADKLGGKGGDSLSGADVMKMDFNSFVKLDEATLSRLRGDYVE